MASPKPGTVTKPKGLSPRSMVASIRRRVRTILPGLIFDNALSARAPLGGVAYQLSLDLRSHQSFLHERPGGTGRQTEERLSKPTERQKNHVDLSSGIELKLKFVPGRKIFYVLDTHLEQQVQRGTQVLNENETSFQAHLRQRILAADDDGSGHIVTIMTPPVAEPGKERQIVYQRVSSSGSVLDVSGMNPTNSFALPLEKVKLNTTWRGEIALPLPQAPQPVQCVTEYAVTGMSTFNGLECVSIDCIVEDFEFDMPMPDGSGMARVMMGSQGSMLFSPAEGILARMEVETITAPKIGEVTFTTSTVITQEFKAFEN